MLMEAPGKVLKVVSILFIVFGIIAVAISLIGLIGDFTLFTHHCAFPVLPRGPWRAFGGILAVVAVHVLHCTN
jgi:hypothetical protein